MAYLRWKKEVAYIVDKSGGKERWIKLGEVPAKAAKKALAKYHSDETYLRLGNLGASAVGFDELCDEYLEDARRHKGAYTVDCEASQLPVFREAWPERRARDITAKEAEDILHAKGYRPSTIKNKIIVLCNVWAFGIHRGYLTENEMKKCRRPALEQLPPVVVSEAAIDAIIDHCEPRHRPVLQVLKYTACRPSEALRLEGRDVDIAARRILFRHTKTKRSRYVPMAKKLVSVLEGILRPGPLFPGLNKHTLRVAFNHARIAARVRERVFLYAFRHFALTKFLDVTGGDLRAAAQLAGHSQIQTTMRYTHRPQEALQRAVDKL